MEERNRFIEEWHSGVWNMAELCREYGVTRKTGYKWLGRYEEAGIAGLADRSRAPLRHPQAIAEEVEKAIVGLRAEHPFWGARKIRAALERAGRKGVIPAVSTIGAVLKQNGMTAPRKKRAHAQPNAQPLAHADQANRVWCGDFKGWFRTQDGMRCDPLTITDAHSRYLLRCQIVPEATGQYAKAVFLGAFREYGLPERIRTDNGAPFGSNGDSGLTELAVWWIRLQIMPERIRPAHPEENGRHERMHRTLKQETASPPAANRRAQQHRFDAFRREYNEQRPHEALGQVPPGEHYNPSPRAYPERLPEPEYPAGWEVRRVSVGGQMRWWRRAVFVSHALIGQTVGLEPLADDRYWRAWFGFYELGVVDCDTGKLCNPQRWRKRMEASR